MKRFCLMVSVAMRVWKCLLDTCDGTGVCDLFVCSFIQPFFCLRMYLNPCRADWEACQTMMTCGLHCRLGGSVTSVSTTLAGP
jgi:hypothetical protein